MKTDLVEIFQTIRANLQPFTANGFTASKNNETEYELWSEQIFNTDGQKIDTVPFASVKITDGAVQFCLLSTQTDTELHKLIHPDLLELSIGETPCFIINTLDEKLLNHIISTLGANFTNFKQLGWV